MWKESGLRAANARYLAPEMTGNDPSVGGIVLRSFTVRSFSAGPAPYLVDLDLTFQGNGTGAWGPGVNTRFVTCVGSSDGVRLVLATSP